MKTLFKAAGLAAGLCFGFGANAATVTYDVTGTVHETGLVFGLWIDDGLDGLKDVTYAITTPGTMVIQKDGLKTTKFLAEARDIDNPANGFDLEFDLDNQFLTAPGEPEFKSVFDAVEHGNEFYLDMKGGTLTGVGALAGLDLGVNRFPVDGEFVFQIGGGLLPAVGANQHTSDFGMSGWFQITSVINATCADCGAIAADNSLIVGSQADVNVDLSPSPVPLPAGALLLLSGLGLIGAMGRRRN